MLLSMEEESQENMAALLLSLVFPFAAIRVDNLALARHLYP